jgi:hypothetical protein
MMFGPRSAVGRRARHGRFGAEDRRTADPPLTLQNAWHGPALLHEIAMLAHRGSAAKVAFLDGRAGSAMLDRAPRGSFDLLPA